MTSLQDSLQKKFDKEKDFTFLIKNNKKLNLSELLKKKLYHLNDIKPGDVVALIGDFDKVTIKNLIYLIDIKAIIVPLTVETKQDHSFFFETAQVDFVIKGNILTKIKNNKKKIF